MPTARLHACCIAGCPALVESGACQAHATQAQPRRGSAHRRGYTRRWTDSYRPWFLGRNLFCGDRLPGTRATRDSRCQLEGRDTLATVVDHITPHRGDQRLFWDPTNHQALCTSCHNVKTGSGR